MKFGVFVELFFRSVIFNINNGFLKMNDFLRVFKKTVFLGLLTVF